MKNIISICVALFIVTSIKAQESTCFGTTKNGRLENGVALPLSGKNFISYSRDKKIQERIYVHSLVKKIVVESYEALSQTKPTKKFKYAETGFKNGGQFEPHKTHQNGLSIDFMVPVLDKNNESTYFPSDSSNHYGYDVEFDHLGENENYRIDFESLAAHIVALHEAALDNDIELWRVIFAPVLQSELYQTEYGDYIKKNIYIPTKKSWVRHDEHFHVDFKIKCKSM